MSSTSIQPATESDLAAIGALITASKVALTINRLLWKTWPSEEAQRINCTNAVMSSYHSPEAQILRIVDTSTEGLLGTIVTTRRTAKPASGIQNTDQNTEASTPSIPDYFNSEVLKMVTDGVAHINKQVEEIDHLEITFVVVKQDRRREGFGSQLLLHVLDAARRDNIPVAVGAEPESYEFFKSHGFVDTTYADFELARFAPPYSGFGTFRLSGLIWRP